MSEVIAEYWGSPSEWIDSGLGYKRTNSDIFSQYVDRPGEGQRQEYNKNIDTSPAFWGWNKDCSWSTKHERSINNGTVQDVYANPENSAPVMGWYMGGSGSDAYIESKYTLNPRCRFAYDNMGDFGEHANYTAGDAYMAIGTIDSTAVGYAWAWTDIEWGKYIALPRISLYKIDNGEFVQLSDKTLTGTDSGQNTLQDYLDDGYVPMLIDMGAMYWGSDLTGTTPRDSIGLDYGRLQALVGMSPIKLTQDMYNYYSTHLDGIYETSKYWIQPDYAHNLEIYQAPFTLFSNGNWQIIDTVQGGYGSVTANYRGEQVIGMCVDSTVGAYNSGLKAVAYKTCATVQQFDDVSYHWETDVYSEGNDDSDTVYTYTKLVIDNYDSEKWEDEAHAYYGAILHECAYFGMKFASTESLARTGNIGSTGDGIGLYLPIFTAQMHTTGLYKTAQEFADDDNVDNDSARDFDFEPDAPDDDDDGGADGEDGKRTGNWTYSLHDITVPLSQKYFVLDNANMAHVFDWLRGTYDEHGNLKGNLDYDGINGGEWITGIKWYPIDIPKQNELQPVKLAWKPLTYDTGGGTPATIYGYEHEYDSSVCTYNLGSIVINNSVIGHGDFRGISKTALYLRLPFYGDLPLDVSKYYPKTMRVEAVVDFVNGVGTYYVETYENGSWFVMDIADFKFGIDIPVSTIANGTYQQSVYNAVCELEQAKFQNMVSMGKGIAKTGGKVVFGAMTGGLGGALTGLAEGAIELGIQKIANDMRIGQMEYNIEHEVPKTATVGGASPFTAMMQYMKPKIIAMKPHLSADYDHTIYAHTVGHACRKYGKLSEFTGLTVCDNVDLKGFDATPTEKALILQQLQNGVYM